MERIDQERVTKNCCFKLKRKLVNFDRYYLEPLFVRNKECENVLSDAEKKLIEANQKW